MHLPVLGVATLVLSVVALPTDSSSNSSSTDTDELAALIQTFADQPEALVVLGLSSLTRRQSIDFALADELPDPVAVDPNSYNRTEAINAVIAEVNDDPLLQKRDSVLVGRDGSTGYTSSISLGNAAMSAPLNCNNADTYMGSRLWNDGFFDETRCAAACTAQSIYNAKHPPSTGQPKLCQFYNTYILLKNGVKQGQYCTLYTQAWDASKATNKGQYRGQDKFTIDSSFIATNATDSGDVSCPSDISYLSANGADFCSAYISYNPPTLSSTIVSTPPTAFATSVETSLTTSTSYSVTTQTSVVSTVTLPAGNQRRAVQTPASVSSWSPSRISAACSQVATGKVTTTLTSTAPTLTSTVLTTTVQTVITTQPTTLVTLTTTTTTAAAACVPTNVVSNGGFESINGQGIGKLAADWTPSSTFAYPGDVWQHSPLDFEPDPLWTQHVQPNIQARVLFVEVQTNY
ncbi:hypothetical protein E4T44_05023 [Aureobasidium sp. EXF-8845]|nr:hypothetical protein E4T44_05023 [Aureobasidium sp. EXF-8845]KAI4853708.1 hypothetical protein E4T45_04220 [Aureobasidium sp. EXF-8846]